MRYLIAFLAVAFMAGAAQAVCPSDSIYSPTDTYLLPANHGPVYGASKMAFGCSNVDWTWAFTRTDEGDGRTIVKAAISNTDLDGSGKFKVWVDSDDYEEGEHSIASGVDGYLVPTISSSPIRSSMFLDATYRDCGHFEILAFKYTAR